MNDKLNHVDYRWYMVRTRPRQESKLVKMLTLYKEQAKNILEVYAPTHTTVSVRSNGDERQAPLFAGVVFVLATQHSLMDFMKEHSLDGHVQYERKPEEGGRARMRVIPEEQMRAFRDYNENYADKVIVLERPYTDYAFNAKSDEPNEIVRVIDGPLAGCEGYICRFRRDKRLVFRVRGIEPGSYLTVSYPNAWDLHVVRLHNTEGDRLSVGTEKGRAADILLGILQACGYEDQALPLFYDLMDYLSLKPSLVSLGRDLRKKGDTTLSQRIAQLSSGEAELILNLARYEHDNPGYVRQTWPKLTLRPFLTPSSGVALEAGSNEAELHHKDFTEIIRRVEITEEVYYPTRWQDGTVTTPYFAHIGLIKDPDKDSLTLFANWDEFLSEYFQTAGKANEKLVEGKLSGKTLPKQQADKSADEEEKLIASFRNFAPTLYNVLTDADSPVKAVKALQVGSHTLNALVLTTPDLAQGTDELLRTCVRICKEINTTTHLSIWRRYLRSVWLHN